ncbi:hypothetical protein NBO_598g0001 [Nosema bombycis CQ1]|uniref:Uncharacterized protein n=1 Tax=Nosema bombycis (strain CQ1 / CVCC 102059) TaxID=578461 RepID=R0M1U4_NOSB1|nr:hypothetical protein NBO_598g0001 [Nosema bombycis CQ1]|eukprot:EOB11994.1 hypothetical protein NBO_598g0001 [Nosema bombycis CQ1]
MFMVLHDHLFLFRIKYDGTKNINFVIFLNKISHISATFGHKTQINNRPYKNKVLTLSMFFFLS